LTGRGFAARFDLQKTVYPTAGGADNYTLSAHNRSSRKCVAYMTTVQSPTRAILVTFFSSIFPVSSPWKSNKK
jgi:hypothetical protein